MQGTEALILQDFLFSRCAFGVITVEHNYDEDKKHQVRHFMKSHDYILVKSAEVENYFANPLLATAMASVEV